MFISFIKMHELGSEALNMMQRRENEPYSTEMLKTVAAILRPSIRETNLPNSNAVISSVYH